MKRSNIVLSGFMGSGKSCTGLVLSERLRMRFVDIDRIIVEAEGRSISDIFEEDGEAAFREIERRIIARESLRNNVVIAVGGGAVLEPENVKALSRNGIIYLLDVSADCALERVGDTDERPLFSSDPEAVRMLLDERRPIYLAAAETVIGVDPLTPEQIADQVISDFFARKADGTVVEKRPDERFNHIVVSLGTRSYPVIIAHTLNGAISHLQEEILGLGWRRCAIITDRNVAGILLDQVSGSLEKVVDLVAPCIIEPGEASKGFGTAIDIAGDFAASGLTRGDGVVAVGGGVVGDLAGFTASVFKRGLDIIQFPTTLMAQVDSSIGGKTAVNAPYGKNMIGTFHQPRAVISSPEALRSLPSREYLSGIAEVLKYSFTHPVQFRDLDVGRLLDRDEEVLQRIISICSLIKGQVVSRDERETSGLRAVLNYGHTLAHALEAECGYSDLYTHGEAVSIGMVFASIVSEAVGYANTGLTRAHLDRITGLGLPFRPVEPAPAAGALLEFMASDKKSLGGLAMLLVDGAGGNRLFGDLDRGMLSECYERLIGL